MYALFSLYLLFCVIKGNFKFGLRIPFLFAIHPMKVGDTMMSSFMFNVMLLLLSSVTVVGLCATAFSVYANMTSISGKKRKNGGKGGGKNFGDVISFFFFFFFFCCCAVIYNIGVKNLRYIKYVWRYYQWALFGVALITLIWLLIWPSDLRARRAGFKSGIELKEIK